MTGFAAIITDAEGVPVTKGTNFTDFCNKYTRNSPIGCLRCQQCDKHGAELALKVGSSVTYYCHAGLMDFAAPIMAGDKMVGCFVGGQVLTSPPDITRIMQVAAEIGIDLINYLQSVMSVPVIEKEQAGERCTFPVHPHERPLEHRLSQIYHERSQHRDREGGKHEIRFSGKHQP